MLTDLWQDLRYGVRMLFKHPGFTLIAVATLALGAQPHDVLRLVIGQGAKLVLAGLGIGVLAALGLTRPMKSLLFGVSASDPLTFAAIVVLLMLVALLACWLPARWAAKVDPMVALRVD